jgi:SNF2 family DNA or RNA helicase
MMIDNLEKVEDDEENDDESIGSQSDTEESIVSGADESDGGRRDDDDFDVDDGERTLNELQDMASKILKKCDRTIVNLRKALKVWAGKSLSLVNHGEKGEDEHAGEDCVDLLEIKELKTTVEHSIAEKAAESPEESKGNEAGDILRHNDIAKVCPNLTLKPYQLVGLNWLKLLHMNGVNGACVSLST